MFSQLVTKMQFAHFYKDSSAFSLSNEREGLYHCNTTSFEVHIIGFSSTIEGLCCSKDLQSLQNTGN